MSKKESYESQTEELLLPITEAYALELVDVEYIKEGTTWYLRTYIDKPGGINIEDCEKVSKALSDRLDEVDFIEEAYILEVSSPGLLRPLKKDRDLERSIGKAVDIKTYKKIDKSKTFTGVLERFDETSVCIRMQDGEKTFTRAQIAGIALAFEDK